ncbi:MAG: DUF3305 domain-containing protein [Bosea sp. (in: a-proteobacteria)]
MSIETMIVGVVVERRASSSPWADHVWAPAQVLPDAPDIAPMTLLEREADRERYYLGAAEVVLYRSDTGHFGDNFVTQSPKLWVSIRPTGMDPPIELVGVTADPHEGEGFVDQMGDIVEPLPMPPEIAARVAAFYTAHHVEREFIKRQRDKHDPRKGGARPARGLDRARGGDDA